MSATDWRFYAIIPARFQETFNTVLATAFGSDQVSTFTVGLSPTGKEPATHYHAYSALSDEGLSRIVSWVCSQPTIPITDPDFANLDDDAKTTWLQDNQEAIETGFGGKLRFHRKTDKKKVDHAAIRAELSLQPVTELVV